MKIGSVISLTQDYRTPNGNIVKNGTQGIVLAMDSHNVMVQFKGSGVRLIIPRSKVQVVE